MYPINPINPMFVMALASSKELQALHQPKTTGNLRDAEPECCEENRRRSIFAWIFSRNRREPACEAC